MEYSKASTIQFTVQGEAIDIARSEMNLRFLLRQINLKYGVITKEALNEGEIAEPQV